jgi:hypothetical protein
MAQVFVSISFEVANAEDAESAVSAISGLPEGAVVSAQVTQTAVSGVVNADGDIAEPEAPPPIEVPEPPGQMPNGQVEQAPET